MAVIAGVATPDNTTSIWSKRPLECRPSPPGVPTSSAPTTATTSSTPWPASDHRDDALAWIREYWGGMIDEGATSFWEAYDPGWPKDDPHVDLQADTPLGYRISLAHGWSSGALLVAHGTGARHRSHRAWL